MFSFFFFITGDKDGAIVPLTSSRSGIELKKHFSSDGKLHDCHTKNNAYTCVHTCISSRYTIEFSCYMYVQISLPSVYDPLISNRLHVKAANVYVCANDWTVFNCMYMYIYTAQDITYASIMTYVHMIHNT